MTTSSVDYDAIIIGAGASGLMCAAQAGYRGRRVLVLDKARKPGQKILISGGGRCNFTNRSVDPNNYLCSNPHFVKSALARFSAQDFIDQVERHGIDFEERDHGQLFCIESAKQIVEMLLTECDWAGVEIRLNTDVQSIQRMSERYPGQPGWLVHTGEQYLKADKLVIASGGLSIPKLSSAFGYRIAEQFGLKIQPTSAGLVPFTLHTEDKEQFSNFSGISLAVEIKALNGPTFIRDLLFTHRGLSGPAVLQISNYWQPGEPVQINFLPQQDLDQLLEQQLEAHPQQSLKNALGRYLPKRLAELLTAPLASASEPLIQLRRDDRELLRQRLHHFELKPNATEGYRTAEVTRGGIDSDELSSKTFEAKREPGLFFIGEVIDVTGWLGGYNFQWAWASGHACGQAL
ncbi:NAD(P)/FAD-dependent oxidoreductase [Motiliproteus coralliicola]|nr:NAD(P)/FAD-dependent oxidoreductase [Motiliproteus coralliicola]